MGSSSCNAAMSAGDRSATAPPDRGGTADGEAARADLAREPCGEAGRIAGVGHRPAERRRRHVRRRPDRHPSALQRPVELGARAGDREARVGVGERPGRLLEREQPDPRAAPRSPPAAAAPRPTQSTSGPAERGQRVAPRRRRRRPPAPQVDHARPPVRPRRAGPRRGAAARALGRPAAHDLDPERARDAVELLEPHEHPHRPRVGENPRRDPLGQGLEEVDPLGGDLLLDRLGDRVVGDHLVDVVVRGRRVVRDLEHDVEADALGDAALGAEGADLDLPGVVAHRDAVERPPAVGRRGARVRKFEGDRRLVHGPPGCCAPVIPPARRAVQGRGHGH